MTAEKCITYKCEKDRVYGCNYCLDHYREEKRNKRENAKMKVDYGEVVKSDYELRDICNVCGHDKINGECACTYVNREEPVGKKEYTLMRTSCSKCEKPLDIERVVCGECTKTPPKEITVIDAFEEVLETLKKLPGEEEARRVIKAWAILLEVKL